jgi:hypothetical protein
VTLRVDRSRLAARPGLYSAVVTARTGGAFVAGTPVAFYVEPPSYDLNLSVTGLPDAAAGVTQQGGVQVVSLDDPTVFYDYPGLAESSQPPYPPIPSGQPPA